MQLGQPKNVVKVTQVFLQCVKHQRSSTVQEEEQIFEGRDHLLLFHKQAHDEKALQNQHIAHISKG